MAVKVGVSVYAIQADTPMFLPDGGNKKPSPTQTRFHNVGEFLGVTTGLDLLDKGVRWVEVYQEVVVKAWLGPAKNVRTWYYWVDARNAAPKDQAHTDWLQAAAFLNDIKAKPRPAEDVEGERLAAEFRKNYPTLPEPLRLYKEGQDWYYSFKTGKTAKVDDFSDLSLLDQQTLAGAPVGASFSGLGLTKSSSNSATGDKKPNYLLIGGIALGSLIFAVGAWFLTRPKGKRDKK